MRPTLRRALIRAAIALLCALAALPAAAAQFTNPATVPADGAWHDLGAGPLSVVPLFNRPPVTLVIADTQPAPAAIGEDLNTKRPYTGASHVWAFAGSAASTILVVIEGAASSGSSTPATCTETQTRVTLAAGASASLIVANASRKGLRWQDTGTNPMTVVPGTGPAVAGVGMNYDPGATSTNQGGGTSLEGAVPTNAFAAISTNGTTATVWECN